MALPSSAYGSMYNNPGRQGSGGQSYNPNPLYQPPGSNGITPNGGYTGAMQLPSSGFTNWQPPQGFQGQLGALGQAPTSQQTPTQQQGQATQTGTGQGQSGQPAPAGSQPATSTQNGTNSLANQIQGLQPFGADTVNQMVNLANAQTQAGAYTQNQQLNNQAAASGFGAYNPSLMNQQSQNVGNANSQVAANQLNIPMQAAQFNAQYGTSLGQLGALEQENEAQYGLGLAGLQTGYGNALLSMLGGLFGGS